MLTGLAILLIIIVIFFVGIDWKTFLAVLAIIWIIIPAIESQTATPNYVMV